MNDKISKIKKFVMNKDYRDLIFFRYNLKNLTDEDVLKKQYRVILNKELDLKNPSTFNEKIQWLKLNDRKEIYTQLVDKYEVRKFIAENIGEKYLIPIIGVWDSADDIEFENLPESFVLKCNHNSGKGMYICKDKSKINKKQWKKICKNLNDGLKQDYYKTKMEWPYKNVKRKIVCEKYMVESKNEDLKDYKLFLFNGKVKYIQVDFDRFTNHHRNFYSTNWEYVPFTTAYPTNPEKKIEKPNNLSEMIKIAEKIAERIYLPAFLRVDLYNIQGEIYFGEITFYHGAGNERFYPEDYDLKLGKMIKIV